MKNFQNKTRIIKVSIQLRALARLAGVACALGVGLTVVQPHSSSSPSQMPWVRSQSRGSLAFGCITKAGLSGLGWGKQVPAPVPTFGVPASAGKPSAEGMAENRQE